MEINKMTLGAAGELRVMSELMLKGFNPAKSYLDGGIDLILENGKKIQVKTARKFLKPLNRQQPQYGYTFTFQDWKNKAHKLNVDFIICWCIEDNIFLIIPKLELKAVGLIFIPLRNETYLRKYINNWDVLN